MFHINVIIEFWGEYQAETTHVVKTEGYLKMIGTYKNDQDGGRLRRIGEVNYSLGKYNQEIENTARAFIGAKKWEDLTHTDWDAIRIFWEENNLGQGANQPGGGGVGYSSFGQEGEFKPVNFLQRQKFHIDRTVSAAVDMDLKGTVKSGAIMSMYLVVHKFKSLKRGGVLNKVKHLIDLDR